MDNQTVLYDRRRQRTRFFGVFVVLVAAFWALIVLNINIGSVPISMGKIARILFLRQGEDSQIAIIGQGDGSLVPSWKYTTETHGDGPFVFD